MEETSLIESESKQTTSTSSVAAIDRIHPLSDLSLFEPGESSPSKCSEKQQLTKSTKSFMKQQQPKVKEKQAFGEQLKQYSSSHSPHQQTD